MSNQDRSAAASTSDDAPRIFRPPLHRLLPVMFLLLLLLVQPSSSSASTGNGGGGGGNNGRTGTRRYPFNEPDRFVSASPPALAAACADGVALVAVHSSPAYEPLLVPPPPPSPEVKGESSNGDGGVGEDGNDGPGNDEGDDGEPEGKSPRYGDLPDGFGGPTRIELIDSASASASTCIVCAGWRADCASLASRCRSVASAEAARYGRGSGNVVEAEEECRALANAASSWMSHCTVSDNVRGLSCVGILATAPSSPPPSGGSGREGAGGCLYLIDATGAYKVRALAIGQNAAMLNDELSRIDFGPMTKEEGARALLDLVTGRADGNVGGKDEDEEADGSGGEKRKKRGGDVGDDEGEGSSSPPTPIPLPPRGTLVEIAVVGGCGGSAGGSSAGFRRLRQQSLPPPRAFLV